MEARYLNTAQAAHYLGISVAQLEKARTQGRGGPPYVKPPSVRRILYDVQALECWMQQGQRQNTSEPESAGNRSRPKQVGKGGEK